MCHESRKRELCPSKRSCWCDQQKTGTSFPLDARVAAQLPDCGAPALPGGQLRAEETPASLEIDDYRDPVPGTELFVIVQTRYAAIEGPARTMLRDLTFLIGGVPLAVLLASGAVLALRSRLRRPRRRSATAGA